MPSDTGASAPQAPQPNQRAQRYARQARVPNAQAAAIEAALGRLIELMNPYSNPGCETHNEYRMEYVNFRTLPVDAQEPNRDLFAQFEVEIDNYEQDWTIRGQTYRVVRGLRIPYRYEVRNRDGHHNGVWATEWLLIGYGGANG